MQLVTAAENLASLAMLCKSPHCTAALVYQKFDQNPNPRIKLPYTTSTVQTLPVQFSASAQTLVSLAALRQYARKQTTPKWACNNLTTLSTKDCTVYPNGSYWNVTHCLLAFYMRAQIEQTCNRAKQTHWKCTRTNTDNVMHHVESTWHTAIVCSLTMLGKSYQPIHN